MVLKTYTFENGFRLIYENPKNSLPISTIQVICDIGSVYEDDTNRGASHMIEHMVFKGTKNIKDRKFFFSEFDKFGAYINATTEKRYTYYTIKTEQKYTNKCITLLSDMLLNSTFDKNEYIKEREVVVEENIKDEDDVELKLFDHIEKIIYNGTPYSYPIDSIKYHNDDDALEHDAVFELYKKMYKPNRMILSIITPISFEKIVSLLKLSYFCKIKTISSNFTIPNSSLEIYKKTDSITYDFITDNSIEPVHICIGFKVCGYLSEDKYYLSFLKSILSDSMMGRLFMILREDNGLTYSSDIDITFNEPNGSFIIYAETNRLKILKNGKKNGVIPLIIKMLNDLINHGVTEEEVKITKGYIKGNIVLNEETNEDAALHNGVELLLKNGDNIISSYDIFEEIYKNITRQKINEIIQKYIRKDNMIVCIIGNDKIDKSQIEKECELMKQ